MERSQTRQDLEAAARRLVGHAEQAAEGAEAAAKKTGLAVAFLAALAAFFWGRRHGRRNKATITITRRS